ncbi:MAG: hypothetical protein JXQ87_18795 [Bacteroidia bacterium]
MKLLFKGINVLDNAEKVFKTVDIEISEGIITKIGNINAANEHQIIEINGLHCAEGFFDPFVNFCEPGLEYKEDLNSGIESAAFGGFTQVGLLPYTEPAIDSRPQIEFIKSATQSAAVKASVIPLFTKANSKNELSEIGEMADAGALAFVQSQYGVVKPTVLLKALEYSKISGKKIVVNCTDFDIIPGAFIHEGETNVMIGMRGIPPFTEELLVKQYIELLRYTDSSIHISGVSCAESIPLISAAKAQGLKLTADTSIYNLLFTEKDIVDFDTNFKLDPPLRSEIDRQSLVDAVKSNVIDVVTCKHDPQDEDLKKTELKMAAFGVIGLQTAFSALTSAVGLDCAINILTHRNKEAFGVKSNSIKEGEVANLSLFVPDAQWKFNQELNKSKSENSMFLEKQMIGKPIGIVNGKSFVLNEFD